MSAGDDRRGWEAKHRERSGVGEPSPFLVSCTSDLPKGRCLDVAAGTGANALFLAERNYRVDAIDWSFTGLKRAAEEAARRGHRLNCVVADLEAYPFGKESYDLVMCFRYLDRSRWPDMVEALRPGGALLMETFTVEWRKEQNDFPERFCLARGELLHRFGDLRVALYRELPGEGSASLLAFRDENFRRLER